MKLRNILTGIFIVGLLIGCGGSDGPGAPGSFGSENTNVVLSAMLTPQHNDGEETLNVDAFLNPDCNGDGVFDDAETFTDHDVHVEVTGALVAEDNPAGVQFITHYEVYFSTVTPGGPPIQAFQDGFISVPIDCSSGTCDSVEFDAQFVDIQRKFKYADDILSGNYSLTTADYPTYVATYWFYGQDSFGEEFGFPAQVTFRIGAYDNCN